MRWLVVCPSAPLANGPSGTTQAHPPGPGFPRHEPSVYTTVAGSGSGIRHVYYGRAERSVGPGSATGRIAW